jgi:hypothetical protein
MTENKRQYVDRNMEITEEINKEENKIKLIGEKCGNREDIN